MINIPLPDELVKEAAALARQAGLVKDDSGRYHVLRKNVWDRLMDEDLVRFLLLARGCPGMENKAAV